ncbi:MAG: hypothetical protein ACI92S_004976, partial [Planctomycetaceae bacterium]
EQSARISAPQFASLSSSVWGFAVGRLESQADYTRPVLLPGDLDAFSNNALADDP